MSVEDQLDRELVGAIENSGNCDMGEGEVRRLVMEREDDPFRKVDRDFYDEELTEATRKYIIDKKKEKLNRSTSEVSDNSPETKDEIIEQQQPKDNRELDLAGYENDNEIVPRVDGDDYLNNTQSCHDFLQQLEQKNKDFMNDSNSQDSNRKKQGQPSDLVTPDNEGFDYESDFEKEAERGLNRNLADQDDIFEGDSFDD
jgi:hypothetical protein